MALRPEVDDPAGSFAAILDEFADRWDGGERPRAEDYLESVAGDEAVELIYHEFCLAESSGLAPDPEEYLGRFPTHRERLSRLFGLHAAITAEGTAGLPSAGDEI